MCQALKMSYCSAFFNDKTPHSRPRREWDWYLVDFSTSLSLALFTLHVNTICFSKLYYWLYFCKWLNQICLFKQRCRYPVYGIYSGCYRDVSCLKRQPNSICRHVPTALNSWGTSTTQSVRGLLYLHSWCMLCLKILACLLVQCVVNATDKRKLLNSATAVDIVATWMTEFSHFCCIYSNNVYSSGLIQSFMLGNMWLPTKMPPIGALKNVIKFEQNIHEWFFGFVKLSLFSDYICDLGSQNQS